MYLKIFCSLLLANFVAACATSQPSAEELKLLDKPPAAVQAKVAKFLPVALAWYQQSERDLLPKGRKLTKIEQALARKLGVKQPEKVRVLHSKPSLCLKIKRCVLKLSAMEWAVSLKRGARWAMQFC